MAAVEKNDVITNEALEAPLQLAKNLDVATKSLQELIKSSAQMKVNITAAESTSKLTKETEGLTLAQEQLIKVQKQVAVAQAQNNEKYQTGVATLKAVKDAIKEKNGISEQEAKLVTAQTASYIQLGAALEKNRKVYQQLTGDSQRNSVQGKELLKVINQQDTDFKKLGASMGKHQAEVGNYREQIEKALGTLGKFGPEATEAVEAGIGKFDLLTKYITGPVIGAFILLFGTISYLKKSFEAFTTETAEGAGKLKELKVDFQALSELGREAQLSVGKAVTDYLQAIKFQFDQALYPIIQLLGLQDKFLAKQKEQFELNRINRKLKTEEIEFIVKGETLQLESAKALFEARDKISNTDKERLEQLNKAEEAILKKEDLEKQIANDRISAIRQELRYKGAVFTEDQKALDLLHDKNVLSKITKDQIKPLAEAEAELDKIEEGFFQSARRRQSLRFNITEDIINKAIGAFHAEQEANDRANIAILQSDEDLQKRIIGNQSHSLQEQLSAIDRFQIDKAKLISIQAEKDKRAAFDSAFGRVEVKPGENATAQQIIDEKTKAVLSDKQYLQQIKAIEDAASLDRQKSYRESGDTITKITVDFYQNIIEVDKRGIRDRTNQELELLSDQFTKGEISLYAYEKSKAKIEIEAAHNSIQTERDKQQELLDVLEQSLKDKKKLSQEEITLVKKTKANIKDLDKAESDNEVEQAKRARDRKLAALTFDNNIKDLQIQIAASYTDTIGNLIAKNISDEESAKVVKKSVALVEIGLNLERELSANALAAALTLNPITAAAQLALTDSLSIARAIGATVAVLAFARGTTNAPGGPAFVGEEGVELMESGGKFSLTPDKTTLMNVPKGSKIWPHKETMQILALSVLGNELINDRGNKELQEDIRQLKNSIDDGTERTVKAIINNGGELIQHGSFIYKIVKNGTGGKNITKLRNFTK